MRHYKITNDLRERVNDFIGTEYIRKEDVGQDLYYRKNYDRIGNVSPERARLLMSALFPEEVRDATYFNTHREEIMGLAKRLQIKKLPSSTFSWTQYLVRREWLPAPDEKRISDAFRGRFIRFE